MALVDGVTGGRSLPPEILDRVVERTDGVPLFVEELTKNLLEGGLLREEAEGYALTGPLPPLAIPSSPQELADGPARLASWREAGGADGRDRRPRILVPSFSWR